MYVLNSRPMLLKLTHICICGNARQLIGVERCKTDVHVILGIIQDYQLLWQFLMKN